MKTVGLEMEEDDDESLLESIGDELTTGDLEDLEQQRRWLEEELEAGQQPQTPQRKEMTITILQEFFASMTHSLDLMEIMDPDCERSGLKRREIMEVLAFYDDFLKKRRRNAMQITLDHFFKKKSSEASTTSD